VKWRARSTSARASGVRARASPAMQYRARGRRGMASHPPPVALIRVREATRPGADAASLVATMAPMEWPTTWTGCVQPMWSWNEEKGVRVSAGGVRERGCAPFFRCALSLSIPLFLFLAPHHNRQHVARHDGGRVRPPFFRDATAAHAPVVQQQGPHGGAGGGFAGAGPAPTAPAARPTGGCLGGRAPREQLVDLGVPAPVRRAQAHDEDDAGAGVGGGGAIIAGQVAVVAVAGGVGVVLRARGGRGRAGGGAGGGGGFRRGGPDRGGRGGIAAGPARPAAQQRGKPAHRLGRHVLHTRVGAPAPPPPGGGLGLAAGRAALGPRGGGAPVADDLVINGRRPLAAHRQERHSLGGGGGGRGG
jgi:hypothetical protein